MSNAPLKSFEEANQSCFIISLTSEEETREVENISAGSWKLRCDWWSSAALRLWLQSIRIKYVTSPPFPASSQLSHTNCSGNMPSQVFQPKYLLMAGTVSWICWSWINHSWNSLSLYCFPLAHLLAQKVLLDYLLPMITIQSHPVRHIALNQLNRP